LRHSGQKNKIEFSVVVLEANGLLVNLKGDGCPSALLSAQSKDLDQLVTRGIQGGDLRID
jgi:hypothetical protein